LHPQTFGMSTPVDMPCASPRDDRREQLRRHDPLVAAPAAEAPQPQIAAGRDHFHELIHENMCGPRPYRLTDDDDEVRGGHEPMFKFEHRACLHKRFRNAFLYRLFNRLRV